MKTLLGFLAVLFSAISGHLLAAEITIANYTDSTSLDPMEILYQNNMQMAYLLYDPLVRYDSDLTIEPRLAERWETIDPTTLRFHLRRGVTFHNGHVMRADDVVFSFERLKQSTDFKALYEPYVGMKRVDEYTVDLIMKKPYPLALANMTYLFVMEREYFSGKDENGRDKSRVAKAEDTFAATHENGTGPFVIDSRQQGVKTVYRKWQGYWAESGNVDVVKQVTIKEDATRVSAVLSGDVDWIFPVPTTDIERLKKNDRLTLHSIATDSIVALQMNQQAVPEFRDRRVRQAVVHAVNNTGIAEKIMRGNATAAAQNSPPGYGGYNPKLKPRYDLDKARRLMREAGVEKGFKVTMITPQKPEYVATSQAVAAMLAKLDIDAVLTIVPTAKYWEDFTECSAGMAIFGWSSDTGDSANYSEFLTMTKDEKTGRGQQNCNGYSNPELDRLVVLANGESDSEKRNAILQEISAIEYDDAVLVPIFWYRYAYAYDKRFKNFPKIINMRNFPYWGDLVVEEK